MPDELVTRVIRFDLQGELGSHRRSPSGGLVVDATISRTGVLNYTNADGSLRRELRHPDEVFRKESMRSFEHATLTVDHPGGLVTPGSWKQVAVGHVGDVHRDGKFLAAELVIEDQATIDRIERGELRELSCGYQCRLIGDSGTHDGEAYDAKQTDIQGNHVAIGQKGWGRAGPDVRIHLDGGAAVSGLVDSYVPRMAAGASGTNATNALLIAAAAAAGATGAGAPPTPAATPPATTEARGDSAADGRIAALEAENKRLRDADASRNDAATRQAEQERIDSAVAGRVELVAKAKPILDAKDKPWSHVGKTDDVVRREVLAALEPGLKLDGRSADFVIGAYDAAVARNDRVNGAMTNLADVTSRPHVDARRDEDGDKDEVEDARDAFIKKTKDKWKGGNADASKKDKGRK